MTFGVLCTKDHGNDLIRHSLLRIRHRTHRCDGIDVGARFCPRDLRETIATEPPIMQTVEPFDRTARTRRRREFTRHAVSAPLQSDRLGAWRLLPSDPHCRDGALAVRESRCPRALATSTLEFKISVVRGMSDTSGVIRTEGRGSARDRRVLSLAAEARITDAKDRLLAHATTTCLVFEFPKGSAKG